VHREEEGGAYVSRCFVDETSALCAGKSYDACFTILIASSVLLCVSCVLLAAEC
jgi:hypothetical protein